MKKLYGVPAITACALFAMLAGCSSVGSSIQNAVGAITSNPTIEQIEADVKAAKPIVGAGACVLQAAANATTDALTLVGDAPGAAKSAEVSAAIGKACT